VTADGRRTEKGFVTPEDHDRRLPRDCGFVTPEDHALVSAVQEEEQGFVTPGRSRRWQAPAPLRPVSDGDKASWRLGDHDCPGFTARYAASLRYKVSWRLRDHDHETLSIESYEATGRQGFVTPESSRRLRREHDKAGCSRAATARRLRVA